jgi:hypothetical protein
LATLSHSKQRTATAASVDELADALVQAGQSFDISTSELVTLTAKVAPFIFEARVLEAFSRSSEIEVPQAITIIPSCCASVGGPC